MRRGNVKLSCQNGEGKEEEGEEEAKLKDAKRWSE